MVWGGDPQTPFIKIGDYIMTIRGAWAETHRPKTIEDTILPESVKNRFKKYVEQGYLPNLILFGPSGTGKTTIAKACLKELGCDVFEINGSLNGIDMLRHEISNFASSISFEGGRKYVIIDEADGMTPATQDALRNFLEEFDSNCGFILTCNYPKKITKHLHSRFNTIDFNFNDEDKVGMMRQFFKRSCDILDIEGVSYDKATVRNLVARTFPDFRKVLVDLHAYSVEDVIDEGIFAKHKDANVKELFSILAKKDFNGMRRWVGENAYRDVSAIFSDLYTYGSEFVENESLPQVIVLLAEYQFKQQFVADSEINLAALMLEIMAVATFR